MVTTKLYGRTGNQMFQIAAAIGYAKKYGHSWHIPRFTVNERVWPKAMRHLNNPPISTRGFHIWKEKSHGYEEIPEFNRVILDGYFQSEKYFNHARKEVLDAFNIPWQPLKEFVSIHVRRGDYLQYSDKHPSVGYDYIRDAVLMMVEKGYKSFVVCSDDLRWCRDNLKGLRIYGCEFTYSENTDPIQDMALMSCCAHQIISNSTFSWWSHWLNDNPEKICIAPKQWFGPGNAHLETKDIYFEKNCIVL